MTTDATNAKPRRRAPAKQRAKPPAKRVTKKDQLIRMLGSATGADVATISKRLGWQTHTTRAALTGLRKAGYEVASEKSGQGKQARYRIVTAPACAAPAATAATEPQGTAHAG